MSYLKIVHNVESGNGLLLYFTKILNYYYLCIWTKIKKEDPRNGVFLFSITIKKTRNLYSLSDQKLLLPIVSGKGF